MVDRVVDGRQLVDDRGENRRVVRVGVDDRAGVRGVVDGQVQRKLRGGPRRAVICAGRVLADRDLDAILGRERIEL
jgi:hypothetical protein